MICPRLTFSETTKHPRLLLRGRDLTDPDLLSRYNLEPIPHIIRTEAFEHYHTEVMFYPDQRTSELAYQRRPGILSRDIRRDDFDNGLISDEILRRVLMGEDEIVPKQTFWIAGR